MTELDIAKYRMIHAKRTLEVTKTNVLEFPTNGDKQMIYELQLKHNAANSEYQSAAIAYAELMLQTSEDSKNV